VIAERIVAHREQYGPFPTRGHNVRAHHQSAREGPYCSPMRDDASAITLDTGSLSNSCEDADLHVY